ncbi:hypothetical protein NHF46_05610 [Arthrobacter alpinus]|nr:hypothetical protein [Arthrobacter alpinus]
MRAQKPTTTLMLALTLRWWSRRKSPQKSLTKQSLPKSSRLSEPALNLAMTWQLPPKPSKPVFLTVNVLTAR